jgi:hypothetical protein
MYVPRSPGLLPLVAGALVLGVIAAIVVVGITRSPSTPGAPPPIVGASASQTSASPASGSAPANPSQISPPSKETEEDALMARLRDPRTDATTRLSLAREGNRRFARPDGVGERTEIEVRALIELARTGEARAIAQDYLEHHPDGPRSKALESLTGVHVPPSAP